MKTLLRKKSKNTIPKAKAKAWKVFSQYIRLKGCLDTTGTYHYGLCYTCNREVGYKESQAGHFISGRGGAYLFDEKLVRLQCASCNIFKHGAWEDYYQHMLKEIGQEEVNRLISLKHLTHKFTLSELEEIEETYKQKVIGLIGK